MKSLLVAASVAAAVMTAACDRPPQPRTEEPAAAGSGTTSAPRPQTGTPTPSDAKDGRPPPVQGQVDSNQGAQHKDFQQRGDSAGPDAPETKPKD
jgi:hypothetical protein